MIIVHSGRSGLAEDCRRKQPNNNISPFLLLVGMEVTVEGLFWGNLSTFLGQEKFIQ